MLPETLHDAMHTFCHVKVERSFDFGISEAWLCHRCSGIYGGFLSLMFLAFFTKWNGLWTAQAQPSQRWWSCGMLLTVCGLQVLSQTEGAHGGELQGWLRFIAGLLVGLALLQALLFQAPWSASDSPKVFVRALPFALIVHAYLSSTSHLYHVVGNMLGLLALYLSINLLLAKDWLKGSSVSIQVVAAMLLIPVEWSFLYYMNVARHV